MGVFGIPSKEDPMLSGDDIQKAIFEVDNVVMDKNNDHGLSALASAKEASAKDESEEAMEIASVD